MARERGISLRQAFVARPEPASDCTIEVSKVGSTKRDNSPAVMFDESTHRPTGGFKIRGGPHAK
jgi:hypothetical protein